MKQTVKELATGYAIGAANIIPGVSGGTFLLIFGLYEKVVGILNSLGGTSGKELLFALLSFLKTPFNKEKQKEIFHLLSERGIFFLTKLFAGAGIAIVTLSALMEYLLTNQYTPTYSLFFGLILASVLVPVKLMKSKKALHLLPFILGTAATIWVASSVNPYDKAVGKSEHYQKRYELQQQGALEQKEDKAFTFRGDIYTSKEFLIIAISGAIAISAMVLPGISGSLVLILLGQYFAVISAVSGAKTLVLDHFLFLGAMAIGMAIGIVLFVKIINFVFEKSHDGTMAFLTGLIAGSLYALWPFKRIDLIAEHFVKSDSGLIELIKNDPIHTNINILPASSGELVIGLIFVALGVAIMIPFLKHEK